jgi:lysozyme
MNDFKVGNLGLDIIKVSEGLRLKAYKCPAGVWTIGYGHTKGVKEGDTCTVPQADQFLCDDCVDAEEGVKRLVRVPLNQNQFDALGSFTLNLGAGNLQSSTLLLKLNQGDYIGAALEFPRWNKAAGKVLKGLVKRRAAEQTLFTTPS